MAAADTVQSGPGAPARKKGAGNAAPSRAPGDTAPSASLRAQLVDATRAAMGLCALAVFVGGFAVGHWFRVRKPFNGILRTVHDPVVAIGIGVTAALFTAGLVWLALRARRIPVALAIVVVGGALAAVANATLWLPGLAAMRTHLAFGDAVVNMRGTLQSAAWVVPPGLFWGVGTATVVLIVHEAQRKQAPDVLDQALWAGGLWLTAVGEACAVTLGAGSLPTAVTATGMILGLVLVGAVIKRRQLKDPPAGFAPRRQLVQKTLAALLVAQAWVGVIWFYWKR